jgi:hypothetical protein
MDPNPVMMLVVRLLAAVSMANDGILFTYRTSAYDELVAVFRPVGFKPVQGKETGTKRIVTSPGFRLRLRPAKISAGSGAPPPKESSN